MRVVRQTCQTTVLLLALVFCTISFTDDDEEGPILAYTDHNCQEENPVAFELLNAMYKDDQAYWSYVHANDQKQTCHRFTIDEMVIVAKRRSIRTVFYDTPLSTLHSLARSAYSGGRYFPQLWSEEAWLESFREIDACWKAQARNAGLYIPNVEYEFKNPTLEEASEHDYAPGTAVYKDGSVTIYINVVSVLGYARQSFYNYYVETIIHEAIHAERMLGGNADPDDIWEEWFVQWRTYDRYKQIYGVEPPSKPLEWPEFNNLHIERNRLKIEIEFAREERNEARAKSLEATLEAHEQNMKKSPGNNLYTGQEIPKCV